MTTNAKSYRSEVTDVAFAMGTPKTSLNRSDNNAKIIGERYAVDNAFFVDSHDYIVLAHGTGHHNINGDCWIIAIVTMCS